MKQELVNREGQPARVPDPPVSLKARQMIEAAHLVLHRVHVRECSWDNQADQLNIVMRDDGFYEFDTSHLKAPARLIADRNYREGWVGTPLTGDDWEDWDAALEDRTIYPGLTNFIAGARSPSGQRQVGNIRVDRPCLELSVVADQLLRRVPAKTGVEWLDEERRRVAITDAQVLLADDRDAALAQIAVLLFDGTPEERRWQLDWMLDGLEPDLVVCRQCFYPVDENDPYLVNEGVEDDLTEWKRRYDGKARYSFHAVCHAALGTGQPRGGKNGFKPDGPKWKE